MAFLAPLGSFFGGSLFGNFALAALAFGANLALAYFFPQKVKGPRAENLKAQTSRYGDHIARCYGTVKTAGAVIWLKDDKVDEHKKTSRGKSLGPEVTEFSYTADFAIAFAWNGPVFAIPRIWADDKLIFDESAETLEDQSGETGNDGGVVIAGADVTIYLGTDTQTPDSHIEADRGAGNVPGYRGIAYAVIRNLPLDEFGIRVPNCEAEIITQGEAATFSVDLNSGGQSQGDHFDIRSDYATDFRDNTSHLIRRLPSGNPVSPSVGAGIFFDDALITDKLQVIAPRTSDDEVYIYDCATGALLQTLTGIGGLVSALSDDITIAGVNYVLLWRANTNDGSLTCLENSGSGYSVAWTEEPTPHHAATDTCLTLSVGPEYAYAIEDGKDVIRLEWTPTGLVSETLITLSALTGNATACHYDEESDSVIVIDSVGDLFVYSPDLVTLLRSNLSTPVVATQTNRWLSRRMKSGTDSFFVIDSDNGTTENDVSEFRVSDLSLIRTIDASETDWIRVTPSASRIIPNPDHQVLYATDAGALWFLPRARRGGMPLADVIASECGLVNLQNDVSAITEDVLGYAIRDGSPPRGVIEDLSRVKFFDFAHIDGVTTFFPRATASARTLILAELGMAPIDKTEDPILVREEYTDERDLPDRVIVRYPAWDATYRTGTQSVAVPDGMEGANVTLEMDTSLVMTDDEAAQSADIILNETREASKTYRTSLGPKHLDLHPGVVVSLPLDTDRTIKAVLTRQAGETVLDAEFRHRGSDYSSEAVGDPIIWIPPRLTNRAVSVFQPIDGHLLRDEDDSDAFYAGVYLQGTGTFVSSIVYRSTDGGSSYRPWSAFANALARGIAADVLPDRPHPWSFDRASELEVWIANGAFPESVTEEGLLSDETLNAFAIRSGDEWEYIRAATIVDNGDGSYTLSTLLRGQKGTEFAMAGHAVGDIVVYLDADAMDRPGDGDRTLTRIYVAVSTGRAFDPSTAVSFQNMGKSLRPWAPVNLQATRDTGDLTGTFNRRDRLGQSWPDDGPETPSMSEDTESYKVRIYDTDGETVLRTILVVTESFPYSAADQTTDFGAPVTEGDLDVGIVQVSATYGDGIEARAML